MIPEPLPILSIDRRRLVREEIETAIDLIFTQGSAIAANLLASAARDVMRGVAESNGIVLLGQMMEAAIKPEKLGEIRNLMRANYNFAKHADRDPDKILPEFKQEESLWSLFVAVSEYEILYQQSIIPMKILSHWMIARRPELIEQDSVLHSSSPDFGDGATLERAEKIYAAWKTDKRLSSANINQQWPPHIEI
jgi:hypothetical protein